MIWSDERRDFTTPGGKPVAVNLRPDSWLVADPSAAAVERAVARVRGKVHNFAGQTSWLAEVSRHPTSGDEHDFRQWIEGCRDAHPDDGVNVAGWVTLLSALRLEGALLWPALQPYLPFPGYPRFRANKPLFSRGALTGVELQILHGSTGETARLTRSTMLALPPLSSIDDIHEEACLEMLRCSVARWHEMIGGGRDIPYRATLTKYSSGAGFRFLVLFRAFEGQRRADGSRIDIAARAEMILRDQGTRGKKAVRWRVYSRNGGAACWTGLFEKFVATLPNKRARAPDELFIRFLDYLSDRGEIPGPGRLSRKEHIVGPDGLLNWLAARYGTTSQQPRKIVLMMRRFFEWERPGRNPILGHDVPRGPDRNNRSNKLKTPREIVQMARTVVRELIAHAHADAGGDTGPVFRSKDDEVWSRAPDGEEGARNAAWAVGAECARLLPPTLRKPGNFEKHIVTVRDQDGSARRLLSPVMPTLLLLLLILPIRRIQARLLDSGEADEMICDLRIRSGRPSAGADAAPQVSAGWASNTHPLARPGRREGALRRFTDRGQQDFLGFYINTNKTSRPGRGAGDAGYEIPWQHPELLDRLDRLRKWQARYNPPDRLLSRNDLAELESIMATSPALGALPDHVFLFRNYDHKNLAHRQFPATENDCSSFFSAVLDEVEARLSERVRASNAAEPDASLHRKPPVLVETRHGRRPTTCAFTLHGLRVAGITAFAEAGVPAPIIAEFLSGHFSVLMTLYYMQFGAASMTRVLQAAEQMIESGALESLARDGPAQSAAAAARLFVADAGSVSEACRDQVPGFWKWSIDGICPNGMTRCENGGPPLDNERANLFGPVEGGARNCPMCRFWLTGPQFVAGQIIAANATLHRARSLALALQGLWAQQADPEQARNLGWIRDRIDRNEAELNAVLRTLNARSRLMEKSLALARQPGSAASAAAGAPAASASLDLITRMRDSDVHVTARSTSQLGYLEFMTRTVRLFPEFEAHDAPIELGVAIDRLLDEHGYRGLMYRLPDDMRAKAGIAFMDCIRSETPGGVSEDEFVDQVARGERRLFTFQVDRIEAEMTRAAGCAMRLEPLLSEAGPPRGLPDPERADG